MMSIWSRMSLRTYSSRTKSSSGAIHEGVKSRLKELYKKIHPDFFHGVGDGTAKVRE